MSEEKMTKKENLRDSAKGILDVLHRVNGNMNLLGGEPPCDAQESIEPDGAVEELFVLLNDIRYLANQIAQVSDEIVERI